MEEEALMTMVSNPGNGPGPVNVGCVGEGDEKEIEGSANYFEEAMRARSPQKRWKAKRESSVFVRNIPYDAASRDLEEHMGVAGDVVSAEIFTTPSKLRRMGRGIVTFLTPEAAEKAIKKLNNTNLKGQTNSVEKAKGSNIIFKKSQKQQGCRLQRSGMTRERIVS